MIEESRDISILKQALQRYAVENYEMAKKLRHYEYKHPYVPDPTNDRIQSLERECERYRDREHDFRAQLEE